ncbi:MAG: EAL domain-containing protein [Gammaproteobacteria bacterium]
MDKSLRLILIEDDLKEAERIARAIKLSGVTVRWQHVTDTNGLLDVLNHHSPTVVLCSVEADSVSLDQVLTCIRERDAHVPVVAFTEQAGADVGAFMQKGAVDLVSKDQLEHLKLVVARAAESQQLWHASRQLEEALRESERRCRALLESSRDAICYVHEGMHVYANPAYLELFGYAALSDVEGTPIMDMVAQDHQQALKELLRGLERERGEAPRLDIGLKRVNGETFTARMTFCAARIEGEDCIQVVISRDPYEAFAPRPAAAPEDADAAVADAPLSDRADICLPPSASETRQAYGTRQGDMAQPDDEHRTQQWRDALHQQRVRLIFQPIVSLRGDPGERFEVHCQARDASGAVLSSSERPHSVESTGIDAELDRWMLAHAAERLAQAHKSGHDIYFFIRLSPATLRDEDLLSWLDEHLRSRGVSPDRLIVGISEQAVIAHLRQVKKLAQGLHDMHSGVALHDFGADANSFQLLKTVPADYLILHRSFVDKLAGNAQRQAALRSVVGGIHTMNKASIAPHVEDAATLSVLWGMSVHYVQGDFLQVPSESLAYDFAALG